ncbi:MAG: hypothetical protein Q8Q60_00680 [Candidatus Chromulinivorax sp.]|nr:hypothetical protein [Candidatus Chromulinivorax sp.]
MKYTKDFEEYIATRFTQEERDEIRKEAELEIKALKTLQRFASSSLEKYMTENKVGFNQLVEKLSTSPSHLAKIKKGEANLTFLSFANLMGCLGKDFDFVPVGRSIK